MVTVGQLKRLLGQLRQRRHYLEKQVEVMPKMLSACLIMRYRRKSSRKYESIRKVDRGVEVKGYGYLTFLEGGRTRHRYVQKEKIGEVAKLTGAYRIYCQKMQEIRMLNKRIVDVLDKRAKIQTVEVKDYVFTQGKRVRRESKKARGVTACKRRDKKK